MKYASKKAALSFICERAPAKVSPKMPRRARRARLAFDCDSKSILRVSIREKTHVSDYPSQSRREISARTTDHRRFVRPGHFWSFGRSDEAEADPGPLQPGM